ncbi:MAG TPA: LysM peptidoglycan-binding domain-containing protein [Candidatus Spyradosoma merdigallinarum]|uniref:LysM peptidoglycan-binding domain-containing protein n=1 Tax=Candidatus Spyradosoma merdigallinarum TaxID=2840950 RepID=A0A9D1T0I3_9BACT|nr:LysM peptidoglycan-binding domain-containing protein [Candidatus Spyradosoma merdigallinarum]
MENSSIDGGIDSGSSESKIPLILAIAAFVLSGLAFIFALNAKNGVARHKSGVMTEIETAVETAKQAAADARSASSGGEAVADLKTDFEELKAQLIARYQEISKSQTQIVQNARTLNERMNRLDRGAAARPADGTAQRTPAAGTPAAAGKYRVKQGDYPAKIAKEHGITTDALMRANPGLDPKRLQIGQEINLPAEN